MSEDAVDLRKPFIAFGEISALLDAGKTAEALDLAVRRFRAAEQAAMGDETSEPRQAPDDLVEAMSDVAVALQHADRPQEALSVAQHALELSPASRPAFHDFIWVLLEQRLLRDEHYRAVVRHVRTLETTTAWGRLYRPLLLMPTFLNLQFVKGKCNLRCRMCAGTNSPSHPDRLSYLSVDGFRQALEAAPTISGVTLSSGDSDPLLHPQFEEIIEVAAARGVTLDVFTNGLPLTERRCDRIVESRAVGMVNFSIDAATEPTYQRIRGGDFQRLHRNIRTLCDRKIRAEASLPRISLSFVAMKDNIGELPAFVETAASYGKPRVFVEDLLGWLGDSGGNFPATDNPRCEEYLAEARRLADRLGVELEIPLRLGRQGTPDADDPIATAPRDESAIRLNRCGWMNGIWLKDDGSMHPCCMLTGVADMGNVADGSVHDNPKFNAVKAKLMSGRVFRECASRTMCSYVQQELAAGRPLRFIDRDALATATTGRPDREESRVRLTVLGA